MCAAALAALLIGACGGDDDSSSTAASSDAGGPADALVSCPNEADASALIGVSATEVTGNVVWGFDAAADETPDDQAAVEGCLA